MYAPIHLHKNRLNSSNSVYLLLIPPIIYVLVLFLFLMGSSITRTNNQIAIDSASSTVLGEEVDFDNNTYLLFE